jgi:hypothetical protein
MQRQRYRGVESNLFHQFPIKNDNSQNLHTYLFDDLQSAILKWPFLIGYTTVISMSVRYLGSSWLTSREKWTAYQSFLTILCRVGENVSFLPSHHYQYNFELLNFKMEKQNYTLKLFFFFNVYSKWIFIFKTIYHIHHHLGLYRVVSCCKI